jgi:hypothetical protein
MDPLNLNGFTGSCLEEVWKLFGSLVTFMEGCGLKEFFLIISIGHCKLKLSDSSVAQILHSVIGGNNAHSVIGGNNVLSLRILQLSDRVLRFYVASKLVAFHVYKLCSFDCPTFKIEFHLWGPGGPNPDKEFQKWEQEQPLEWTTVPSKRKNNQYSYAEVVRQTQQNPVYLPTVKKQHWVHRKSVFEMLQIPVRPVFDHLHFPFSKIQNSNSTLKEREPKCSPVKIQMTH